MLHLKKVKWYSVFGINHDSFEHTHNKTTGDVLLNSKTIMETHAEKKSHVATNKDVKFGFKKSNYHRTWAQHGHDVDILTGSYF